MIAKKEVNGPESACIFCNHDCHFLKPLANLFLSKLQNDVNTTVILARAKGYLNTLERVACETPLPLKEVEQQGPVIG